MPVHKKGAWEGKKQIGKGPRNVRFDRKKLLQQTLQQAATTFEKAAITPLF